MLDGVRYGYDSNCHGKLSTANAVIEYNSQISKDRHHTLLALTPKKQAIGAFWYLLCPHLHVQSHTATLDLNNPDILLPHNITSEGSKFLCIYHTKT